jgi:hypothetical protein
MDWVKVMGMGQGHGLVLDLWAWDCYNDDDAAAGGAEDICKKKKIKNGESENESN